VLALRADFYANCLNHPPLSAALNKNLYNVPLIGAAQLREAIENRLALAAARAEPGLIDSLLADVGAEPGNLALLEHALAQLWEKSGGSGGTLSNQAYADIGRLRGALGKHADDVYRGLGEADQQLAQRIFLELVQLGEGAQDTRRRVPKQALLRSAGDKQVERVIARLASQRLVTTSGQGPQSPAENFVEVSHEALIREWPRLREWLKDNREDLRLGRLLMRAAEEWLELKRDPSALMHGVRLAQGLEWLGRNPDASDLLREFLEASNIAKQEAARKEREAQEREIVREKELRREADRRRAAEETAARQARHSALRSRRLSYALGALLLITAGAGMLARRQQLIAQSRALAAQAESELGHDPPKALDLALQASRTHKTTQADEAVADAFPQLMATLSGHTDSVVHAEFSPDGRHIVTASSDGTARLWNTESGQLMANLRGHTGKVSVARFSPVGERIVTASKDKTARVWNAANGQLLATLSAHTESVVHAEFSPDGQHIVTASHDHTARIWNAADGQLLKTLQSHTDSVYDAAFSPDGQRIVTASSDGTARLWKVANGQMVATLRGHTGQIGYARFSPDGRWIVTVSDDRTARVWNAANGGLLANLKGHTGIVWHAAFSLNGQRIVTASDDHTARLECRQRATAGHPSRARGQCTGSRVLARRQTHRHGQLGPNRARVGRQQRATPGHTPRARGCCAPCCVLCRQSAHSHGQRRPYGASVGCGQRPNGGHPPWPYWADWGCEVLPGRAVDRHRQRRPDSSGVERTRRSPAGHA